MHLTSSDDIGIPQEIETDHQGYAVMIICGDHFNVLENMVITAEIKNCVKSTADILFINQQFVDICHGLMFY